MTCTTRGNSGMLSRIILLLISSVTFFVGSGLSTYAFNVASFDRLLQNAYTSAKQGTALKNLPSSMEKGNIYDQAYKVAQEQNTSTLVEAIDHVTYSLNSLSFDADNQQVGDCTMQFTDSLALLSQVPGIAGEIKRELGRSSRIQEAGAYEEFWKSCEKLYACYGEEELTDRRQTKFCQDVATNAYYMGKIHSNFLGTLTNANNGDNIFVDNRLDNSAFDILVDIEKIGDVLFEENKKAAEILFFKFPTVTIPGGGNNTPNNTVGDLGFGDSSSLAPSNNLEQNGTGQNGQADQISQANQTTNTDQAIGAVNDFINQSNTNNPFAPGLDSSTTINNHVCLVPEEDDNANQSDLVQEQLEDFYDGLASQYDTLLNDPTDNLSPISAQFGPNNNAIGNTIDTARAVENAQRKRQCANQCEQRVREDIASIPGVGGDVVSGALSAFEEEFITELCEADCCIKVCEQLPFSDRVICTTDCLCGETASDNGMFRIRFCKIPAQGVSTIPRTVQSIEEVVTELHNTIKKLQEMGEPIKTTKTREYYDSSLQDVSFGEIFFFDVFVKVKPIFQQIPEHIKEQEQQEKNLQNQTDLLNFGNLIDANERNKYVIIDESAVSDGAKSVRANINTLKKNIENAVEKEVALAQEQQYIIQQRQATLEQQALLESTSLVGSEVAVFLQHNMQFWQQVNETLQGINLSARNLRDRIQQAD